MSESITTTPAPSTLEQALAALRNHPAYTTALPDLRPGMEQDMAKWVAEGLPASEFLLEYAKAEPSTNGQQTAQPAPAAVQPPDPAAAAAEQARQRAALRAAEEVLLKQTIEQEIVLCKQCYQRGEQHYAIGLLEAGQHAHLAVQGKLRLLKGRKSREAAIQAVEGQLAQYSSGKVDANALIASWWSWHLLAQPDG